MNDVVYNGKSFGYDHNTYTYTQNTDIKYGQRLTISWWLYGKKLGDTKMARMYKLGDYVTLCSLGVIFKMQSPTTR